MKLFSRTNWKVTLGWIGILLGFLYLIYLLIRYAIIPLFSISLALGITAVCAILYGLRRCLSSTPRLRHRRSRHF